MNSAVMPVVVLIVCLWIVFYGGPYFDTTIDHVEYYPQSKGIP